MSERPGTLDLRRGWRLLLFLPALLGGCVDSLGIGSGCAAEMQSVRRSEGRGPDATSGPDEIGGNFAERWTYEDGPRTRVYTFRWGASYASCEVDGPILFYLLPVRPGG